MFGEEFLAQGLHLKSHQRCSAGIMTCLSARGVAIISKVIGGGGGGMSNVIPVFFSVNPCLIDRFYF